MPTRLKSLELHGFKSFARPTTLVFGDRLTAIVGPNGAGKSNIVDALRWVLGEPSLRLLRARRVEDLIFAGTDRRPRAGMASVTVVFDNEDGWLPVDFAEVALTRRVDREGRSDLFLNGRRVRLRDVKELLAQAGLAEGGYAFIGQGMVDRILQLRPEERRRLFEEAAGIGLYRQRREEALRRLDITRQNLDRVEDLLAELEPRFERLKRRVARMEEARRVEEQLRRVLALYYGQQARLLARRVHEARRDLDDARQELDRARRAWLRARQAREAHDQTLRDLRQRQQDLLRQLQQAEAALQQALQEQARLQEALQHLRDRLLALEREENEARTRAALAQNRLEAAQAEEARLRQDLEEAQARYREAREAWQAQKARREEARRRLRQAQEHLEALQRKRAELEAQHRALERRLQQIAREVEGIKRTLKDLEEQLSQARQNLEEAETRMQRAQQHLEKAREAEIRARERAETLEREHRAAQEEGQRLQARLREVEARLEVLAQAEARQAGYAQAARQVARAAEREGLLVGLVAGLLPLPPEHEPALTAVLAPWADAVVVRWISPALWEAARGAPGQVVLLPLEDLKPPPPPEAPQDPDWQGWAAPLVAVEPHLAPLVQTLLGRVGLVRHAEAARRLLPHLPSDALLVTARGEVFSPDGKVRLGTPRAESLFRRTRERQELRSRLAALQAHIQENMATRQRLEEAWHQARQAEARARQDRQNAEDALTQARRERDRAATQVETALQAVALRRQRLQELEAESATLREEQTRLTQEMDRTREALQQARETLQEAQKALSRLSLDDLFAEMAYWERRQATVQEDHRKLKARLEQATREWEQAHRAWQAAQERRRNLMEEARRLEQRLQAQQAEVHRRTEAVEQVRQRWEPFQAQWQAALEQAERLRQGETEARQTLRARETAYQEALLALQRAQSRRAALLRRMREEGVLPAAGLSPTEAGLLPLPGLLDAAEAEPTEASDLSLEQLEARVRELRQQRKRLGPVVPEILQEYRELEERITFLRTQIADLRKAEADLLRLVDELDTLMKRAFRRTFERVHREFQSLFTRLFGGGKARLVLTRNEHGEETGVDIEVRLPGKRTQRLALLSGGERSLTAVALIFALLKVSPTPFCVLDEVDAMLDEANVGRFLEVLHEFSREIQFVVITHHQLTVQAAQVLYGVTLDEDGTSQVLSLKLEDVPAWLEQHTPTPA